MNSKNWISLALASVCALGIFLAPFSFFLSTDLLLSKGYDLLASITNYGAIVSFSGLWFWIFGKLL